MPDFHTISLTDAADALRRGTLSPVTLVRACLERIERLQPVLHAFITVTADTALARAREVEQELRSGRWRGPLHGIPLAWKDNIHTRGVRTTAHSRLLEHFVPGENATVFDRLEAAGAISLGKTSLHEFAFGGPGPDEAFPAARNPWNPLYTPGSSSSGSGAAVAAGLCVAAVGTDTGGSVRHPAAVCGIVGMKPTYGRVSLHGVIPLAHSLDHVGPLTRTVRDNALMLNAMAGYDPRDPTSLHETTGDFAALIDRGIRGMRLGVPRRFLDANPHHPAILAAFAEAERLLRVLGAEVVDIDVPGLDRADDAGRVVLNYEAYRYHREELALRPECFGAPLRERLLKGKDITEADYRAALVERDRLAEGYAGVLSEQVDAIVTPGKELLAEPMADLRANPTRRGVTNRMYNLTGMPALTLPMGFDDDGMPMGLQIAAAHFREEVVYCIAAAFEDAAGWCHRHPVL